MRVIVGLILVISLFGCSKEAIKNNTRMAKHAQENASASPTPEPPVFIEEMVTTTSLGKTKLEIYQGEKGVSPVLGQVGQLRAISETTVYSVAGVGEYSPETEVAPDERSFPVYWIEVKPDEVAMAVFVDESLSEDLKNPHRNLRRFEVQPPGVEYCSEYRFRGEQYLNGPIKKELDASRGSTFGVVPEPTVACMYRPEIPSVECRNYFKSILNLPPVYSRDAYRNIEKEKDAYECSKFSAWYPPKKQYTETWDLKSLVVKLDSENKSIGLREERSPLIPGGTQMKTISFSETEVEFKR